MGLGSGASLRPQRQAIQAGSALPALGAKGQRLKINSAAAFLDPRKGKVGPARLCARPPYLPRRLGGTSRRFPVPRPRLEPQIAALHPVAPGPTRLARSRDPESLVTYLGKERTSGLCT